MPGIGKNTRRLVAYVKKETEQAIQKEAKSEGTSTGKILDAHFTQMKPPDKSIEERPKIKYVTPQKREDGLYKFNGEKVDNIRDADYMVVTPTVELVKRFESISVSDKHFEEKEDGK